MFSKFIEGSSIVFIAFIVAAFSVAMVGMNQGDNHPYPIPHNSNPQVQNFAFPSAEPDNVAYDYANNETHAYPVQYIDFPPMHIIVTPSLNN